MKTINYVHKLSCILTKNGKKNKAQKFVRKALILVGVETNQNPQFILKMAIDHLTPLVEFRKIRRGSQTFFLPRVTTHKRRQNLAMRWLVESVLSQPTRSLENILANIIIQTFKKEGKAFQKKIDWHKQLFKQTLLKHANSSIVCQS